MFYWIRRPLSQETSGFQKKLWNTSSFYTCFSPKPGHFATGFSMNSTHLRMVSFDSRSKELFQQPTGLLYSSNALQPPELAKTLIGKETTESYQWQKQGFVTPSFGRIWGNELYDTFMLRMFIGNPFLDNIGVIAMKNLSVHSFQSRNYTSRNVYLQKY